MSGSGDLTVAKIIKSRYRPTKVAEEFLRHLQRTYLPGGKYKSARLAIARSLYEPQPPEEIPQGLPRGTSIEGTHLLGDDAALWACVVIEAADAETVDPISGVDVQEFRSIIESHWHRGAGLLESDLETAGRVDLDFILHLVGYAGASSTSPSSSRAVPPTAVNVPIGEVSIDCKTNKHIKLGLNAKGHSPHIAVMGKTRSGKTRTGLAMAESILSQVPDLPLLLIDPKGEFVDDRGFIAKPEWRGRTLGDRFPGAKALSVPKDPVPLDFLALPSAADSTDLAQAAIRFRDTFKKCIRSRGDVAMDDLREVVERLLTQTEGPVSMQSIRDEIDSNARGRRRKKDTVQAKFNELTSLQLFEPKLRPEEFFRGRWVIGLGRAAAESKNLVMFLLLDALANHLLSSRDSALDSAGNRALQHLLVVDEAKEILGYRHDALSGLVRKSASKGGAVMLLSQSPEDFDKETDDFLSQMGTVLAFTSTGRSARSLGAAFNRRVDLEELSDQELPAGVAWAKLPGLQLAKIIAWE